jgi:MFS family permease
MVVMTMVAPLPVIPDMLRAFASQPGVKVLIPMSVVVPTLTIALSSLAAGAVGDRIGHRRLLNLCTAAFAVLAPLPFWLTSFPLLLVSRALVGVALGGMSTAAVALTGDYFSGLARQRWLAIQGAAGAGSAVLVSAVGGALGEINWRLPFLMLATGVPLFVMLVAFPGPAVAGGEGPIEAGAAPAGPRPASRVQLAAIFALGVLASFLIWPPVYELGVLLGEKGLGSPMLTGLTTSVLAAGAVAGAMALGLFARLSPPVRQAWALAIAGAGIVAIWAGVGAPLIMVGAFAVGVGEGMTTPILSAWLLEETPPAARGRLVGLYQTIFFSAQFSGPLFAQTVADHVGGVSASLLLYGVATAALVVVVAALRLRARVAAPRPA